MAEECQERKRIKRELKLGILGFSDDQLFIDEILYRLTFKNVIQLRSVSKAWLQLLSKSEFVRAYYKRNDSDCLIVKRENALCLLTRYEENYIFTLDNINLVGSFNGMIVLNRGGVICLWNPYTEYYVRVEPLMMRQGIDTRIGAVYMANTDTYKIVIVNELEVFMNVISAHGEDVWRSLGNIDDDFDREIKSLKTPHTIVKNNPIWVNNTINPKTQRIQFNLSQFDGLTNSFQMLFPFSTDLEGEVQFVCMEHQLRVLVFSTNDISVFGLDSKSWRMMRKIQIDLPSPCTIVHGFRVDELLVVDNNGGVFFYQTENHKLEKISHMLRMPVGGCFRYQPSIASIKGMVPVFYSNQGRDSMLKPPRRLIDTLRGRKSQSNDL